VTWIVELLDDRVLAELDVLPADMKARFRRKDGISRAIYVTAKGRRVVVVRVFVKKARTTPRREIDLALERAREVTKR
jgi:phage-related protein